jgi:serine phosphatase RsbU (regulator of sigma subunit)
MTVLSVAFSSCGHKKQAVEIDEVKYDSLCNMVWYARDTCVLHMIDSLETAGELSENRADYLRGMAYDRSREIPLGDHYYNKVYQAVDPEKEGWDFYLRVAVRLSQLRLTTSDNTGSITVATEALEKAKAAGKLTDRDEIGLLWSIAGCQFALHLPEAKQTSMRVYELLEKQAKDRGVEMVPNLMVYRMELCESYIAQGKYDEAEVWNQRFGKALTQLDTAIYDNLIHENAWHYPMNEILILKGQGKDSLADAVFEQSYDQLMELPEGMMEVADYLLENERYAEAADIFVHIDSTIPADNKYGHLNLDNIEYSIIPRLKANLGAGRTDTVLSIARKIADNYENAFKEYRDKNAAELATIYQTQEKDAEIAQQQIKLTRQRWIGTLVALALLSVFFIIYTWYRRRAQKRLATAHSQLQEAYDQLEETTTAKERIESELRIARDIQMSMVPGVFPEYEGLDMFAAMTPAKEVGGDLYGYVLQSDALYFCVGDVSGKGVPASLFMAQSSRLFRTLASEGMMPADIAVRMNNALSENNETGMFVTMFIGLLNLKTGHLDYCNCGHNAPVIGGQFLKMQYANQPLGLWEDDPFYGESIDDIRGKQMLVYTDGLNEAENPQQELLGNDRLLELMADHSLTSRQVIEKLLNAVEEHRAGANPNDDLTLMCLSIS